MRRRVQHAGPFVQGLFDHPILFDVELHDGLLEVPDASMDEFGASAGSAAGEVVCFD